MKQNTPKRLFVVINYFVVITGNCLINRLKTA